MSIRDEMKEPLLLRNLIFTLSFLVNNSVIYDSKTGYTKFILYAIQ